MGERRSGNRRPVSTYRLQINADFDLFAAARRLPYLHELGVDWVYLSPLLAAEPGSNHGYDVVSHDHIDASRGGADGLAALSAEARRLGLGVLVDIVPNHVGIAGPSDNAWWWDVLTHGRGSAYASSPVGGSPSGWSTRCAPVTRSRCRRRAAASARRPTAVVTCASRPAPASPR